MNEQDFTTSFTVDKDIKVVYDAINNVRGWWSENIEGAIDKLGSIFNYHYQDVHVAKFKIIELTQQRIVWHVLENRFKFTKDAHEWKDTHIQFDLTKVEEGTQITFTHLGLTGAYECYDLCSDAWTHYIQGSLKKLITTGIGEPTPKEGSDQPGKDALVESEELPTSISIYHRLRIDVPVESVFNAITTQKGLAGWWTPDTQATPEEGSILRFGFGSDNYTRLRIDHLHHYDKVEWTCIESNPEWIGTTITFELEPHVKGTILKFTHGNWKARTNEFAGCSYVWALFLRSLKRLCETGTGTPFPDFDK